MKKRVVYFILSLVLIFGLMPIAAFADDEANDASVLEPVISDLTNQEGSDIVDQSELEVVNLIAAIEEADEQESDIASEPVSSIQETEELPNTIAPNPDNVDSTTAFSDVLTSDWFYEYVEYAVENGLMNGVGEGLFDPNGNITRGMFATILYRLEGEPAFMNDNTYSDVASGSYYEKAIVWCSSGKVGIVQGYGEGLFGPDDNITREQLAKMLYNYACYKGDGFQGDWMFNLDYSDKSLISDWAFEAVAWCVMNNLISGFEDGSLQPQGTATRAQAAKILTQYVKGDGSADPSISPFVGDYENPKGNRISIDDNGDGTFAANARIVPTNGGAADTWWGSAVETESGLEIDFLDPDGNHTTATLVKISFNSYDFTITGSLWDDIPTGTKFTGFIKK